MAGAGAKLFTSGSVLTADQVNTYLMDQTIMRFSSTTTRDAAFGGAGEATLAEGMFAYTTDTNTLWFYTGSAWQNVLGSNIGQISLSNRNKIINGDFDIWQRGTTITNPSNSYTADRWVSNSAENQTYTRQTSGAPSGSQYYARLTATQASCFFVPNQFIETNNTSTLWGKTVVASLLIRRNATMNTAITFSLDKTSTVDGGLAASWTTIGSVVIANADMPTGTGTTDWYKATFSCSVPNDGTANTLRIRLLSGSSANNSTVDISQVQLEEGAVATPFEFEDISTTLAKCQRYYQQQSGVQVANFPETSTTSNKVAHIFFPVTMRAAPTSTVTYDAGSSTGLTSYTTHLWTYRNTGSNATNTYVSAWTASAEL